MQNEEDVEHQSMEEDDSNSESDEFFEAEEEEVSFGSDSRDSVMKIEAMLKNAAASAISGHNRIGARCPVPDVMPLVETGDQVRLEMVLAVDSEIVDYWVVTIDNPKSVYSSIHHRYMLHIYNELYQ